MSIIDICKIPRYVLTWNYLTCKRMMLKKLRWRDNTPLSKNDIISADTHVINNLEYLP